MFSWVGFYSGVKTAMLIQTLRNNWEYFDKASKTVWRFKITWHSLLHGYSKLTSPLLLHSVYTNNSLPGWLTRKFKAVGTLFLFHDLKSLAFTSMQCTRSFVTRHVSHESVHTYWASHTLRVSCIWETWVFQFSLQLSGQTWLILYRYLPSFSEELHIIYIPSC